MTCSLSSGAILEPSKINLNAVEDYPFLVELAHELDASVLKGLDIGRRLGWDEKGGLWHLGQLDRAYFVQDLPDGEHEPDEFHKGIAPSVKLLNTVVSRLADVSLEHALVFCRRLKIAGTLVHDRMWAALACTPLLASPIEVAEFLEECSEDRFWNINSFPEIAGTSSEAI